MTVTGEPAALVTGLEGTFVSYRRYSRAYHKTQEPAEGGTVWISAQPPIGPRVSIEYTNGKRLTWYVGDVKVEMLSNLSEEEMLKIAESLAPAEREGDSLRWRLLLPRLSVEIVPLESEP